MATNVGVQRMDVGGACSALSVAPSCDRVVVCGRDVLKIVPLVHCTSPSSPTARRLKFFLDDDHAFSLRTGRLNLTFSSHDVQWCPSLAFDNLLCTAATNGKAIVWNLECSWSSKQEQTLDDHSRTINRVSWHQDLPGVLLTASQDGTVKLWDIRSKRSSQSTFQCRGGAVRDVQWAPSCSNSNGATFATCCESGVVEIWDSRLPSHRNVEILAHNDIVLTLDWHPSRTNTLATGSRDRSIKIWDMTMPRHPVSTLTSIASVARVKWRPFFPGHIASAATIFDNNVHLWNIRLPHMPIATFGGHRDVVTGLAWVGDDASMQQLLTCGKDAQLLLHDVEDAKSPHMKMRPATASWSPLGHLAMTNHFIDRAAFRDLRYAHGEFEGPSNLNELFNPTMATVTIKELGSNHRSLHTVSEELDIHEHFEYVAEQYALGGDSFEKLCDHNSRVNSDINRLDLTQAWQMLKLLFSTIERSPEQTPVLQTNLSTADEALNEPHQFDEFTLLTKSHNTTALNTPGSSAVISTDQDESGGELSPDNTRGRRPRSQSRAPHSKRDQSVDRDLKVLPDVEDQQFLVADTLLELRQTMLFDLIVQLLDVGDVQTIVTMVIVLANRIPHTLLGEKPIRQWFTSYIGLLQRRRLWTRANDVIRASADEAIYQLNQCGTAIYLKCMSCSKGLDDSKGPQCKSCQAQTAVCSVCRLGCRGRFVWCQTCGHGGHAEHMQAWFAVETLCPAGCSHQCVPAEAGTKYLS